MDTRSGELLSACLAGAMSISLLTCTQTPMFQVLSNANALPEWAIMGLICSVVCFIAVFMNSIKLQALARFLSGCVWGTVILIYVSADQYAVLLWCAVVLFCFDIYAVTMKGRLWTLRNPS